MRNHLAAATLNALPLLAAEWLSRRPTLTTVLICGMTAAAFWFEGAGR